MQVTVTETITLCILLCRIKPQQNIFAYIHLSPLNKRKRSHSKSPTILMNPMRLIPYPNFEVLIQKDETLLNDAMF